MPDENMEALQAFHGTPQHQAILDYIRKELVSEIASFLSDAWSPEMQAIHLRAKTLLSLLVNLRLDNVDVRALSKGVVSQFESLLPSRIELRRQYEESLSERPEDGT